MQTTTCSGVWPAVATPFKEDLSIDHGTFLDHCLNLLADGASGLGVFGTTGEANSLSVSERISALDTLIEGGIPSAQLLPGTGCCAEPDTVALTRHATESECAGVLMLPPYFYKGVSEEGLFTSIARVIDDVGSDQLRIYLYHIPQLTGVGWSIPLLERLVRAYPDTIAGVKDSSGDWQNTRAMLHELGELAILPGSEAYLVDGLELGAAGCISATANLNVAAISNLYDTWREPGADAANWKVIRVRKELEQFPLIPGVKAVLAHRYQKPGWNRVRPPLIPVDAASHRRLLDTIRTSLVEEIS